MRDVILHAFDWSYDLVVERAEEIARIGYGAVLLSPPLYSDPDGPEWWQRYQPKDYRLVRSRLGGLPQFRAAIDALHLAGVRVFVDVVFNHMANEKGRRPDPFNFPGDAELARYRAERASFEADRLFGILDNGLFSPWDFNPEGDIKNWNDLHESQEHALSGLPDLDLNDWVVERQRECLRAMNALGVDGYRLDAVKHLPEAHISRVFRTPEMDGKYLFGESLTANDGEENLFLWPLLERTGISYYDFPLYETMRRALAPSGSLRELADPAAFRQALPWDRAVTFSVTHDIPNNDVFRWQMLDRQDEHLANVYVMGRDGGVPLLYSDGNESARRYPDDRDRWAEAWCRADGRGMVAFHNAVQGTRQSLLHESDTLLVFARGDSGIVAINKGGSEGRVGVQTAGLRRGPYRCAIHGGEIRVEGDRIELVVPPRQARMWLRAR